MNREERETDDSLASSQLYILEVVEFTGLIMIVLLSEVIESLKDIDEMDVYLADNRVFGNAEFLGFDCSNILYSPLVQHLIGQNLHHHLQGPA